LAFAALEGPGMVRHLAFESLKELVGYMASMVPKHAYYSSAYYENPAAKLMGEKGWMGADLVFDIDVDHVDTPCKAVHDKWRCLQCGASGRGSVEACPHCGSERLEKSTWICETCLSIARDEALKLIDLLQYDFGLSKDELFVVFSGHRGFHIHVENDATRVIGQDARREITEYVKGIGIDLKFLLVKARGNMYRLRFGDAQSGWHGKLSRWLIASNTGTPLSLGEWESILRQVVEREGAAVDEKVTIDIHRLIRLPGTLHGKTGLRAVKLDIAGIEKEDWFEKAKVWTRGEAILELKGAPGIVLDHKLEDGRVRVPLYVAVYLLLNSSSMEDFKLLNII